MATASAAVVLAVIFGLWLTLSITRPMRTVVDAANALARGDLGVKVATERAGRMRRAHCFVPWRRWLPRYAM
jgi:nitrogen fixation/metabolism regulation signal transduction histidine kinase